VDVKIEKSTPYVFVIFLEEIMERPTHGVKSNVQGELAIGYMFIKPFAQKINTKFEI
jgi:hypothetical protein